MDHSWWRSAPGGAVSGAWHTQGRPVVTVTEAPMGRGSRVWPDAREGGTAGIRLPVPRRSRTSLGSSGSTLLDFKLDQDRAKQWKEPADPKAFLAPRA